MMCIDWMQIQGKCGGARWRGARRRRASSSIWHIRTINLKTTSSPRRWPPEHAGAQRRLIALVRRAYCALCLRLLHYKTAEDIDGNVRHLCMSATNDEQVLFGSFAGGIMYYVV